jgi:hypothetical protein
MKTLLQLTPNQLRRAADIKDEIEGLQKQVNSILCPTVTKTTTVNRGTKPEKSGKKLHWTQTPAGRRRCAKNMATRRARGELLHRNGK